jgi:acetate kinase
MNVLALNAGSSSLRFAVFNCQDEPLSPLVRGTIEGVGGNAVLRTRLGDTTVPNAERRIDNSAQATEWALEFVRPSAEARSDSAEAIHIDAAGHRVVHGGDRFTESALITEEVLAAFEELTGLSPVHNPVSLSAIGAAREILGGGTPMVAVFDTAFHQTLPPVASQYALPYDLAQRYRIRRYGFHGLAHASLAQGFSALSGKSLSRCRLITLQLGNGCSITAIRNGQSVDTSMGFTPLEGLVMGTRCGDLDPAIVTYLLQHHGLSAAEIENILNTRSGVLGVSGISKDIREVLSRAGTDPSAALAIDLFCYRVKKYIGSYLSALNGADAILFGGGIGENSPAIRSKICDEMDWFGLSLDSELNEAALGLAPGKAARISQEESRIAVFVVGTDEESLIARETLKVVKKSRIEDRYG